MNSDFWDRRFGAEEYVYGDAPNTFLAETLPLHLPPPADVIELGAGEGRNAVFFAKRGYRVTALDYSRAGIEKTKRLADAQGVAVEVIHGDVVRWRPERQWDAVLISFLHLPPPARPALYRKIREILAPGGVLVAEWFRPEQITEGFESGGPPRVEMMVTEEELRAHFPEAGILRLESVTRTLDEGAHHAGPAAVVRLVWRAPE
ncbi:SAM-dependent methyltransferase [Rhodocaloribacter sp.]